MRLRRGLIAFLIAAIASACSYALTSLQIFEATFGQLEYKTIDYRMRSSIVANPDSNEVVLVLFDSASVAAWPYLSPFPRAMLAGLVDVVAASGAKAIGLDVFLGQQYAQLNALDSGDVKLRAAIERAGNVVLVGPSTGDAGLRTFVAPDTFFADVAAGVAVADLPTPFETIRDAVLTIRTPSGLVPGFALALYAKATGANLDSLLAASAQSGELELPRLPARYRRIDRAAVQTVPITFEGPPSQAGSEEGAFRAFSSYALLQLVSAGAPLPWMRDKVVLLGSGFHDSERFRSPFYDAKRADGTIFGWTYGVEVHANALQNLLSRRFLVPLPTPLVWLLLLGSSVLVTAVLFRYGVNWGVRVAVAVTATIVVLAIVVFQRSQVVVPMISPLIGVVLSFLGATSYVSIVEGREKRLIRSMFGKYVSPRVVDELVADPSRLKLGGEKRHITILFSDLAGFTGMSERLDPEKLVSVLNQYLNEMSALAMEESGLIDKYIGDAIMALYGAPTALEDHALHACKTAIRMQRRLAEMNRVWQEQDPAWPQLEVRIGINTGTPVVGNIGGEEKFDYTALGDAVNLAARLEPACKTYGVGTMIAQATREEAGDRIQVRELDLLAVYGKKEPIRVYELIDLAGTELPEAKRTVLRHYEQGLAAFRRRDFELAQQYFEAALEADPAEGPSALYLERCVELMITPPPADWDFVERRQFK